MSRLVHSTTERHKSYKLRMASQQGTEHACCISYCLNIT